jgi:hypothetical protein
MKMKLSLQSISVCMLPLTITAANADTLVQSNTPPYFINQINIGSNGDQIVTDTMFDTLATLNWYWFSSSSSGVFNYSINYSPTSLAFAAAEVYHNGVPYPFLAYQRNLGTSPSAPITVTGSVSMDAGSVYLLEVGLYNYTLQPSPYEDAPGIYMGYPVTPNGSYELDWNVSTTAHYSSVLNVQGGDPSYVYIPPPSVPLPGTFPLFATGLAGLGLLGWRRKKAAAG